MDLVELELEFRLESLSSLEAMPLSLDCCCWNKPWSLVSLMSMFCFVRA